MYVLLSVLTTDFLGIVGPMEQCTVETVNNCLNTIIYSYLETSGNQSSDVYLNVVYFFKHQC
jgi:hypothetical protein